jgi:HAMP domain-containing protein
VRVSRTVGREGQMGDRVTLRAAAGDWATGADALNALITDVLQPTTEVARVLTAVAEGDLSQKMALDLGGRAVQGEFLRIGTTVNRMVDQLNSFSGEVTRVAREVGTEGQLGGQANVPGVAGTWKDLTDSVNAMAGSLTTQVRNIADVTKAVAAGDLSRKITVDAKGEMLELKNTINTMVDQLSGFASEVTRVAREVGTEGVLGGQARVPGVAGTWADLTENVNAMASNLTGQVRNIADVTTAVARGDLSRKITWTCAARCWSSRTPSTRWSTSSTRSPARSRAWPARWAPRAASAGRRTCPGVAGTWKDLTDNVNQLAGNLTVQLRDVSGVASRHRPRRPVAQDHGRGARRGAADQGRDQHDGGPAQRLRREVTRVASEVGSEGRLGGQANVPGRRGHVEGPHRPGELPRRLAHAQVRNIAEVTTAVARGDLSRKITVDVQGEVLELKNTINTMVDQLSGFASEVTRVAARWAPRACSAGRRRSRA